MATTRMSLLAAILALFAGLWLNRARAQQHAGPERILVLDPRSRSLPAPKLRLLARHLRQLVARYPSLELVRGRDANLSLLRIRARCRNFRPACLAALGRMARADRVLHTRISALPGRFLVEMQLVDVASERVVDSNRQPCRRRLDSVRNAVWKAWVALQGPLVKSQLKVSANVAGAEVWLDGRLVGHTPLVLTKQLARGQHQVEVRHPGWAPMRRLVEVKGAEGVTLDVKLSRLVAVEPVPRVTAVTRAGNAGKLAGGKDEAAPEPTASGPSGGAPGRTTARAETSKSPASGEVSAPEAEPRASLAKRPSLAGTAAGTGKTVMPHPGKPGVAPSAPLAVTGLGKDLNAPVEAEPRHTRWWRSWWFWTAVGVAAAAATATGIVLGMQGEGIPAGHGRVTLDF